VDENDGRRIAATAVGQTPPQPSSSRQRSAAGVRAGRVGAATGQRVQQR